MLVERRLQPAQPIGKHASKSKTSDSSRLPNRFMNVSLWSDPFLIFLEGTKSQRGFAPQLPSVAQAHKPPSKMTQKRELCPSAEGGKSSLYLRTLTRLKCISSPRLQMLRFKAFPITVEMGESLRFFPRGCAWLCESLRGGSPRPDRNPAPFFSPVGRANTSTQKKGFLVQPCR